MKKSLVIVSLLLCSFVTVAQAAWVNPLENSGQMIEFKPASLPADATPGQEFKKPSDSKLEKLVKETVPQFKQYVYVDKKTGFKLPYNLYTPQAVQKATTMRDKIEGKEPSTTKYPLVMFIADASAVGKEVTAPLKAGYGGIIWASKEEQKKNPAYVLVPEYAGVVIDDHDGFKKNAYVELTARMLQQVASEHNVDVKRIYGTGQSMGCMITMDLAAGHPNLFGGILLVGGQWDTTQLENLASQHMTYITAAGDPKASAGQAEVEEMLLENGNKISKTTLPAKKSPSKQNSIMDKLYAEKNNLNFATFELGTVLPKGVKTGTSEHMYSFDYAYKLAAVRNWLFRQ